MNNSFPDLKQVSPIKGGPNVSSAKNQFFGDAVNFSKALNSSNESIPRPSRKDIIERANQNLQMNKSFSQFKKKAKLTDRTPDRKSEKSTELDIRSRAQFNDDFDNNSSNGSLHSQVS